MSSEDKVQFKVYIRERVLDVFRQYLSHKWHTVNRGILSAEAEHALIHYMECERKGRLDTRAHKNEAQDILSTSPSENGSKSLKEDNITNISRRTEKYAKLRKQILDIMNSWNLLDETHIINDVRLREAIKHCRNVEDKRTIDKTIEGLSATQQIRKTQYGWQIAEYSKRDMNDNGADEVVTV